MFYNTIFNNKGSVDSIQRESMAGWLCDVENIYRPDRRNEGSALYVHDLISYHIREDLS